MTRLERELIQSIKKGNPKSFELAFKTYYSRLCVYACSFTKQVESAEDLVKDVFIVIWDKREKLEIKSSLSAYLFRSVHNSCINYLERDKNRNNLSIEEMARLNIKMQEPLSEDYLMGKILANELEEQIFSEIEKLPDSCKRIFKLSRFEGLPHKKIAEKLKISENTVKSQIYNGLKNLKEALSSKSIILFNFFSKK